jgi:hypothetical protein
VKGDFAGEDREVLDFLSGDYIVVEGQGETEDQIIGRFFGGMMQQMKDYKYVGPGNFAFVTADGKGELWLRAEKSNG